MSLPYHSLLIDSSPSQFRQSLKLCLSSRQADRAKLSTKLEELWTTPTNPNYVLPCLSVRSALDLYLQAQAYPTGSEVIMTAINIPDIARVIRHHKLKIITVDISIDTLSPSQTDLERLVTRKTVAILVAHLFGRCIEMDPVFAVSDKYNLHVIEDCAERFSGLSNVGHPKSNIALFSFGVIKFSTAFGGAIAKVKDHKVWFKMSFLETQYPAQTNRTYFSKVLKYLMLYTVMYTWPLPHAGLAATQAGYDPKEVFIKLIQGFSQGTKIQDFRYRPSPALLSTMLHTYMNFNPVEFRSHGQKGDFFLAKLTHDMYPVGTVVKSNIHWLFPVLVKNPEECVKCLNAHGVSAYRGSTQLSLIEGDKASSEPVQVEVTTHNEPSSKLRNLVYSRSPCLSLVEGNAGLTGSTQFSSVTLQTAMTIPTRKTDESERLSDQHLLDGNDESPFSIRPHSHSAHTLHGTNQQHPTPEAKYLMDHVIYLPVNKRVPYKDLDRMATICSRVMNDKRFSWQQVDDRASSDIIEGTGKLSLLKARL